MNNDTLQMFDALSGSINVEDIASNNINTAILRRIQRNKDNDKVQVYIQSEFDAEQDAVDGSFVHYIPESAHDMGWLGYFIGKNDHVETLYMTQFEGSHNIDNITPFFNGVSRNKSIRRFEFNGLDLWGGKVFTILGQFFKNNTGLEIIYIEECVLGEEGARLLALAIGSFNSLTELSLIVCNIADEGLVDIITALSMHPNMKTLDLDGSLLNKNGCKALATLLQHSATELESLDLRSNQIDDEGIDALVPALKNSSNLQKLWLNNHPSITSRGWQQVSTILKSPNSNLKELHIMSNNNIDDEAAAAFASSLVNNSSLGRLELGNRSITEKGWGAFSKLLCDISSINSTFLSNHTLRNVVGQSTNGTSLQPLLSLNRKGDNEKQIAIIKILQHHNDFDMMPFFEWEFKVLPLMIEWFEKASTIEMPRGVEPNIGPRKLSTIYQFVRGMPDMYVETRLRQELEEIKAARLQMEERERYILERLGRNA